MILLEEATPNTTQQAMVATVCTPMQEEQWFEESSITMPEAPEHGALVKMTGCGLCGSDLDKVLNNKAQAGQVLGHELVGVIEAVNGEGVGYFNVGDRIVSAHHVPCLQCQYCLNGSESMCRQFKTTNFYPGGFSQYVALTHGHLKHTAFKIPEHISDVAASAIEPLACVLKAIERGEKLSGRLENGKVGIIGLGFIGLMAGQVYKQHGYQVTGIEISTERQQLAINHQFVDAALDPKSDLKDAAYSFDVIFLTVLNQQTVKTALTLLRDGGTLVIFSGSKPDTVTVDPNTLYFREITLVPSYSPSLHTLKKAANMVFNQQINVETLCTHQFSLKDINKAVSLYKTGKAIKVLITP